MSEKVESKDGGFKMDLGSGEVIFKGTTGIKPEARLDRIENKMDRILNLLESKDLSVFTETHGVSIDRIANSICNAIR